MGAIDSTSDQISRMLWLPQFEGSLQLSMGMTINLVQQNEN